MSFISWQGVIKAICAGLIFICTVVTILLAGPVLDGRYAPVLSHFEITRTVPISAEETAVYGTFTKYRDCEYIGMSWYRKDGTGTIERVGLRQVPPPGDIPNPTRPLGRQNFGPWNVAMAEADIRPRSYVEVAHSCTWLWITKTVFYP